MVAAVLILSGGRSSRMGSDKAQLKIGGCSLLEWQIQRFEKAGFRVIHSVPDDRAGFLGPLSGIESAMKAFPEVSSWLVLPVDMPYLSIASAKSLIASGEQQGSACSYRSFPMPLFLNNPNQVLSLLSVWLSDEQGPRAVRQLIRELGGCELPAPDQQQELNNLNTPEQWQQFIAGETTNESCS